MRTDRQTGMTKLIVAIRQYANATQNGSKCEKFPIIEAGFSPKKVPRRLAKDFGSQSTFPPTSVHLWTAVTVPEWTGGEVTSLTCYDKHSYSRCHKYKNLLFGGVILHTTIRTFDIKCITQQCWHKNYLTSTNIYLTAKYDKIDGDVSHSKAGNPAPYRLGPSSTQAASLEATSRLSRLLPTTNTKWRTLQICGIPNVVLYLTVLSNDKTKSPSTLNWPHVIQGQEP